MRHKKLMRILLAGGGSGGHIFPLLAVVESLKTFAKQNDVELDIRYCGPTDQYVTELVAAGVRLMPIMGGKLRRYFSLANIIDVPKWFIGLIQAFFKVYFFMPDVTFSKGGTGGLPVVIVSFWYRIPVLIHESDAMPGLSNLLSAWFAKRIAISFESARPYFKPSKTALTGNPVRAFFIENHLEKEVAREELHFERNVPLVLVLGGSQGSTRINEFIISNLTQLMQGVQILHQVGNANYADMKKLSDTVLRSVAVSSEIKSPYRITPFLNEREMKNALDAADMVITRPGSGAIFEIALFGKPSILIPIKESANNHQRINAYAYAETGAAIVIEEDNLTPSIILSSMKAILGDPAKAGEMGTKARQFAKPEAAELLAEELLRMSS